ncbi:MAG: class I poly(R)-hydroxyalkanoic acid synthase [Rhodospirillaceae bacterium]|nr:class I poly(R)-hydroxyalkanoic acid synthase [Rhodospirillaceae bacterium]
MSRKTDAEARIPTPSETLNALNDIMERGLRLITQSQARHTRNDADGNDPDPLGVGRAFAAMTARMLDNPAALLKAQADLCRDYATLWQNALRRATGENPPPVVETAPGDKRFRHTLWNESILFDTIKQSYLLWSNHLQELVGKIEGLDERTARKADFYTRRFIDALSPANFALTNPEVLQATIKSGGQNLIRGAQNLMDDLERGNGLLAIRMTDPGAFEIGRNIATTPGKVVYRNDLIELLQFDPTTATVHEKPLMIIPPWINKYYILDLRPSNSFVRWAVAQGHTVFMLSWVNPGPDLAGKSFEDYMHEGPLAAIDAIEKATGSRSVNAIGYCLGGTLLATTMAYLAAKADHSIASATYFASLADFTNAGELCVFIDEEQLSFIEKTMAGNGYFDGTAMSTVFSLLRANDLIWSFVVNNYLLGRDPFPHDLLYWNSDSTHLPAAMHSFYLRKMYMQNLLAKPGGIVFGDVPLDLRAVQAPTFLVSCKDDHITPWKATYAATRLYGGPVTFILSASGHIAGIVNPPEAHKYNYWSNTHPAPTPEEWFDGATRHDGSWWPEWQKWVAKQTGPKVAARVPGDGGLAVLGDAPGDYVKKQILA